MGLIRPRSFVVVLLVLLALALTLPAAAAAASSWTEQTLPVDDVWYGVSFPDVDHGWAVGLMGNIISTTDGGSTWTVQTDIDGSLFECYFSDASHGWAVGPDGVYATTDGSTWAPQSAPPATW